MLPKWDGKSRRDVVMEALSFTPITLDFDGELGRHGWWWWHGNDRHGADDRQKVSYQSTFQLLERAVLDNTAESQLALLSFYTRLLQRWHVALQAAADISGLGAAIDACVDHVSKLSLTLTQTTPTTACFLAILDFYDCVTSIVSDRDLLRQVHIAIPPAALVYIIYFAPSLAALSRLCGVLAAYKGVFEMALGPKAPRPLAAAEREAINGFNGFVMDICNCLLRSRAFSAADARSQACLMSPSVLQALNIYVGRVDKGFALGSMLGLSHSPLLSMLSMAFIRDLEQLDLELEHAEGELSARHAGPVTQSSLIQLGARGGLSLSWNSYRSGLLEYLEAKGVRGIPDLMYMSMKSLRRVQPTE